MGRNQELKRRKSFSEQFSNFPFFFFFPRFPPQNPNLQPAVVAVGDLGHLRGDTRHLKVIDLEDPTPWDVDVGGLGDVDDGIGLGARDVVEIGFISTVEAGLEKESKWRIQRVKPTRSGTTSYCWWWDPQKNVTGQPPIFNVVITKKCWGQPPIFGEPDVIPKTTTGQTPTFGKPGVVLPKILWANL